MPVEHAIVPADGGAGLEARFLNRNLSGRDVLTLGLHELTYQQTKDHEGY